MKSVIAGKTKKGNDYLSLEMTEQEFSSIVVKNGMRLCQDNLLRKFANFGTFPECVKIYKSYGWAEKAANKIGGEIVILDAESYMDASGDVIKV